MGNLAITIPEALAIIDGGSSFMHNGKIVSSRDQLREILGEPLPDDPEPVAIEEVTQVPAAASFEVEGYADANDFAGDVLDRIALLEDRLDAMARHFAATNVEPVEATEPLAEDPKTPEASTTTVEPKAPEVEKPKDKPKDK